MLTKRVFVFVFSSLILVSACTNDKVVEVSEPLPSSLISPKAGMPGNGINGGPILYDFFVSDQTSTAPFGLAKFSKVTALRLATSQHFVLYRQAQVTEITSYPSHTLVPVNLTETQPIISDYLSASRGQQLINQLENSYVALKAMYGAGLAPNVQGNGRIVILAYDIQDDYSSSSAGYFAGFFTPRDLYANQFTEALYTNLDLVANQPIEKVLSLRGSSNENNIIYLDLHPLLSGAAFKGSDSAIRQDRGYKQALETALHELSHLFTYYNRNFSQQLNNADAQINEGIAEMAPLLLSGLFTNQQARLDQWSLPLIQNLLSKGPSLLQFGLGSETEHLAGATNSLLASYLQSNLFFNYLTHRGGGNSQAEYLLHQMINHPGTSLVELNGMLSTWLPTTNYQNLFRDWAVTNYLAASGKQIISYQQQGGSNLSPMAVGIKSTELSYQNAGIHALNQPGVAFKKNGIPYSFTGVSCLEPSSAIYYIYSPATAENIVPAALGTDSGLKLVALRDANNSQVEAAEYFAGDTIALQGGSVYTLIIYNDSTNGNCLPVGNLPRDDRYISAWVGGGNTSWSEEPGALRSKILNAFFSPAGVDTVFDPIANKNYMFIADAGQMSVIRYDMQIGQFQGRLGSMSDNCATDIGNDFFGNKFLPLDSPINGYCRSNLHDPSDVLVVEVTDIGSEFYPYYLLIADRANYRIIRRKANGEYAGMLGHPACTTPAGANPITTVCTDYSPLYPGFSPANVDPVNIKAAGGWLDRRADLFQQPNSIVRHNNYIYVLNFTGHRIARRRLTTDPNDPQNGTFAGIIGNGIENWFEPPTTNVGDPNQIAAQPPLKGDADNQFFFTSRAGLAIDNNYVYVADSQNNRIIRWGINGNATGDCLGANVEGWHSNCQNINSGANKREFSFPADVEVGADDGAGHDNSNYLYVADRKNHRIVRFAKDTGNFAGWVGLGITEWELTDDSFNFLPDPPEQCSQVGATSVLAANDMCEPSFLRFANSNSTSLNHNYLLMSAVYYARVSRINLDCVEDNSAGGNVCSRE